MSNWLPFRKRRALLDHLMAGRSIRETARLVGCSKVTVSQYRKLIRVAEMFGEDIRLPKCECGQNAGHRGWCRVRFARSERRQCFMQQWRHR